MAHFPVHAKRATAPVREIETDEAEENAGSALDALTETQQQSLWTAFSEARRAVTELTDAQAALPHNEGVHLFAANPGQQLTARFKEGEVKIESGRYGHWQGTFRTRIPGDGVPASPILGNGSTSRVEYHHAGGFTEWYENRREGIEQGFTVAHRPAWLRGSESLKVTVEVEGLTVESLPSSSGEKESLQLVDPVTGEAKLRYGELKVWDAKGQDLFAYYEIEPNRIDIVVADAGAVYPVTIDPLIVSEEAKLLPSFSGSAAPRDYFGYAVCVSGDTVLVGAYGDNTPQGSDAGSAYVFVLNGQSWSLQAKLLASDGAAGDWFGVSADLDGDTAVLGASKADFSKGAVYVFVREGTEWSQQAKLAAFDGAAGDVFGSSVSVDGEGVVVGAPEDGDSRSGLRSGSAYVFERSGFTWVPRAKLEANDARPFDYFGIAVCLDGHTILVGAYRDDTSDGTDAGSAHVFVKNGVSWSLEAKLVASDGAAGSRFGNSVSVSGDTALVGAFWHDTAAGADAGCGYVFDRVAGSWGVPVKLVASDGSAGDFMGCSVSVDGDRALVGAYGEDARTGGVHAFERTAGIWGSSTKISARDGAVDDFFGISVCVDGDTAVIGSFRDDTPGGDDAGSASVWTHDAAAWIHQAVLDAGDGAEDDRFGSSVSLSGDLALVGVPFDDTPFGANAGSAYIFERTGIEWELDAKLEATDGMVNDSFGSAVSLDGTAAIVGAFRDDNSSGTDAGSAYVFRREVGVWQFQTHLLATGGADGDLFGGSVCIRADHALVGAASDDTARGVDGGSAEVFEFVNGAWHSEGKLEAPDGSAGDYFGVAVDLGEDTALIGAHGVDRSADSDVGAAYVFSYENGSWGVAGILRAGDGTSGDEFGVSVSLHGSGVLIGARNDDTAKGVSAGSAYVFELDDDAWVEVAKLEAADGAANDFLGSSVDLHGDLAAVGALGDSAGAGRVHLFERVGGVWGVQAVLAAEDGASLDRFGTSLSISDDTILVGANFDDTPVSSGEDVRLNHGGVYVFRVLSEFSAVELQAPAGVEVDSGRDLVFVDTVILDESSRKEVILVSSGTLPLSVTHVALNGSHPTDFLISDLPASFPSEPISLEPAANSTFRIAFVPGAAGLRVATLSIESDASDSPFLLHLSGTGITAGLAFSNAMPNGIPDGTPSGYPYSDGVSNLEKYAFNMDLEGPDGEILEAGTGTSGLPHIKLEGGEPDRFLRIEFLRRIGSGLAYIPQKSVRLTAPSWEPLISIPTIHTINDQWERVIHREPVDQSVSGCFGRVQVTLP